MKKKAILISSISAIMLCVGLIVGLTFALFTSETAINVSIRSAVVNIDASIKDCKLYSAKASADGALTDEYGATYVEEEQTNGKFANGGSATIKEDGTIAFTGMTAGDKVQFTVDLTNTSNISIKYNTLLALVGQETNSLFSALNVDISAVKKDANGEVMDGTVTTGMYDYDMKTKRTGWTLLNVDEGALVTVRLSLPITQDHAQGRTAKIRCTLSGIQYTGTKDCVAVIGPQEFSQLEEAVSVARDGDLIEVLNGEGENNPVGKLTVDNKSITIVSADGKSYEFTDAQFELKNGGALTLDTLTFKGNSYINASEGSAVTMKGCTVNAAPEKLIDEGSKTYLERAAFVVSTSVQQTGIRLEMTNNTFLLADDNSMAAVFMESAVTSGTLISGNTFGSEQKPFADFAVELRSIGTGRGATVTVSGNEFFGEKAVKLDQKRASYSFRAYFGANKQICEGEAVLAEIAGGGAAELYDSFSTVNSAAVTTAQFVCGSNVQFGGVNITFDETGNGLVTGGYFEVNTNVLSVAEFLEIYLSPLANTSDVTAEEVAR